jgi:hypothetical protein
MRRWWLASCLVLGVVASAAACGGKVAVDLGGAGGGTSTSTGTSTQTTSSGCSGVQCKSAGDGTCTCVGTCFDQSLEVDCANGTCTCIENQIKIFNCAPTGANPCDLTAGCCAAAFFGGGG